MRSMALSFRLTMTRRAVADPLIAEYDGTSTAADLTDRRTGAATRASAGRRMFRSLELLTELGVVERLDLPSGEHADGARRARVHHHVVDRVVAGRPTSRIPASPRPWPHRRGAAAATALTRTGSNCRAAPARRSRLPTPEREEEHAPSERTWSSSGRHDSVAGPRSSRPRRSP